MSKVVFLSMPLYGHINPTLPLVKELVARGEEVVYYANDAFEPEIRRTGAHYRAYQAGELANPTDMVDSVAGAAYLVMGMTRDVLALDLARIRQEGADYIIHDFTALWGRCVAQLLRLPAVCSIPTYAYNRNVASLSRWGAGMAPRRLPEWVPRMRKLCRAIQMRRHIQRTYGLRELRLTDLIFSKAALNIVFTSKLFQPFAETFDERFKFVGPPVAEKEECIDFPWGALHHDKLIYVSLGTLIKDARFFLTCFDALKDLDCQVVLSTGRMIPVESLGQAPDNCIVRDFVPQLAILRRAAVFISHGGMNSVSDSLYYGVPLVVTPFLWGQPVIAGQVERLGAGLRLERDKVTSGTLREAVQRVWADETYRRNSVRIGDSFREAGGATRAADEIFAFKAAHGIGSATAPDPNVGRDGS